MSNNPINFTSRTYDTILDALIVHIRSKYPNDFKDFTASNVGMAILEAIAYVADNLSYYIDIQANELYLPTAKDRASIINIGKLVGYTLSTATPASVPVRVSISSVQAFDVVIPSGTSIYSNNGVRFEFIDPVTIPVGLLSAEGVVTAGTTVSETFTSDGSAFQKIRLSNRPYIQNTLTVKVNGNLWNQVDSLVISDETDQSYTVDIDEDDYAYIQFGNDVNGKIPPTSSTISVTYRVGGGVIGNIVSNGIVGTVTGQLQSGPPQNVTISVVSTDRGTGGRERESIEHARYWIPRALRASQRAVTLEDFATLASLFRDPVYGSPAFASAALHQLLPEMNRVNVYLWSYDSNGNIVAPTQGLINAVQNYFDNNGKGAVRLITVDTVVSAGENIYIDVDADISVRSGYVTSDVINNAKAAIEDLFEDPNLQPGTDYSIAKLYNTVLGVEGVTNVIVNELAATKKYSKEIVGDNGDTYSTTVDHEIRPHSVYITVNDKILYDDGAGNLLGNGTGTVDYATRNINITFDSNIDSSDTILVEYRSLVNAYRNDIISTANGVSGEFSGVLPHAPVVPGTLSISDGVETITDDGAGNLVGDVDPLGDNTIDYRTGSYTLKFNSVPIIGAKISTSYYQLLSTKESIPIAAHEMAVKGRIVVNSL